MQYINSNKVEIYNLSKPPFCYWDLLSTTNFLQRRIIVYSLLYYELDVTAITDKQFDCMAKQLVRLHEKVGRGNVSRKTQYGYALYDFDGTTGFDIADRLNKNDKNYLMDLALQIKSDIGGKNGK